MRPASPAQLEEVNHPPGRKRARQNVQGRFRLPCSQWTAAGLERGAGAPNFERPHPDCPPPSPSPRPASPANNSINIPRHSATYAYSKIATEPSVAVVVDDIPQSFSGRPPSTALVDVSQVGGACAGPQNTLFRQVPASRRRGEHHEPGRRRPPFTARHRGHVQPTTTSSATRRVVSGSRSASSPQVTGSRRTTATIAATSTNNPRTISG